MSDRPIVKVVIPSTHRHLLSQLNDLLHQFGVETQIGIYVVNEQLPQPVLSPPEPASPDERCIHCVGHFRLRDFRTYIEQGNTLIYHRANSRRNRQLLIRIVNGWLFAGFRVPVDVSTDEYEPLPIGENYWHEGQYDYLIRYRTVRRGESPYVRGEPRIYTVAIPLIEVYEAKNYISTEICIITLAKSYSPMQHATWQEVYEYLKWDGTCPPTID